MPNRGSQSTSGDKTADIGGDGAETRPTGPTTGPALALFCKGHERPTQEANMQIPVLLDRSRPETLTTQIVEQLARCDPLQGRIAPGTRLPSSRRLAEQLAVSRNTVVRAYDAVADRRLSSSRVRLRASYVAEQLAREFRDRASGYPIQATASSRCACRCHCGRAARRTRCTSPAIGCCTISFPADPSADLFPLKTWRRLLQANLSHGGAVGLTQYAEPAGLPALRTAIANHLAVARGIVADPSRIFIVVRHPGRHHASLARLFLARGTLGVVEDPCYHGAALAVRGRGRRDCQRRRSIRTG